MVSFTVIFGSTTNHVIVGAVGMLDKQLTFIKTTSRIEAHDDPQTY